MNDKFDERLSAIRGSVHERFFEALNAAGDAFSPEELSNHINAMLTKERREIILKLIGFDSRYGGLEVDRTNRRDETSIVGMYLRKEAKPIIQKWLEDEIKPVLEAKARAKLADAKVKTAIEKTFSSYFEDYLRQYVREAALELAKKHANDVKERALKVLSLSSESEDN